MSYKIPISLYEYVRKNFFHDRFIPGGALHQHTGRLATPSPFEAFIALMSDKKTAPYEYVETSRREVHFFNECGHHVGSCDPIKRFFHSRIKNSFYTSGGETVEDALARLEGVSFIVAVYYLHGRPSCYTHKRTRSVMVYKL